MAGTDALFEPFYAYGTQGGCGCVSPQATVGTSGFPKGSPGSEAAVRLRALQLRSTYVLRAFDKLCTRDESVPHPDSPSFCSSGAAKLYVTTT